jgi:DNA-binding NarL/FixJ family response regulator
LLFKLALGLLLSRAGETPNAAYYLQHGQVEDSLKEQMRLAFAGNAGVPPAAAKQMKKSKRQLKQDDAKRCRTTGARVMLCFSSLRLGFY